MAMGTRRKRRRQHGLWISAANLPPPPAHPFYRRVNAMLDAQAFDEFVERTCRSFYADTMGRPSLTPGMYFRLLLVGYFEGIDSERGIAWRAADSLAIRQFLHLALDEAAPDHSTISRTRRLIDLETPIGRSSRGSNSGSLTRACLRARPSRSMPPRSRPMPRCAASCDAIRERAIRSF